MLDWPAAFVPIAPGGLRLWDAAGPAPATLVRA
jgi:hypothetical protein